MTRFSVAILSCCAPFLVDAAAAADSPAEARETIAQWVETQRAIARERAEWREERAALEQSLKLLEREADQLEEGIAELSEAAGEADDRAGALAARNSAYRRADEETSPTIADLEEEVRSLRTALPLPLETKVAPLFDRIDRENDSAAGPQRLQALLALLNEVHDFQQTVTLSSEVRELDDGSRREVQTIYLGLAQAFFVDGDRRIAGSGRPGEAGWEWTRNDDLADRVSRAVAILENRRPAEYIHLPVALAP